jgi:hypothetical protein
MGHDDGFSGPENDSDRQDPLWQELAAVVRAADPVSSELLRIGRDSFTWRTIEAELAELAFDSVGHALTGVRGAPQQRQLTFEAPSLTLEVEVRAEGEHRRLLGQLVPPGPARVMIRHQGGIVAVEADETGRFRVDDLPAGPGSLRCHLGGGAGGAPVVTDWVTL